MNILFSDAFDREIKRLARKYPSLSAEVFQLTQELRTNPTQGTPMGRDCYKIRLAIASKGKRNAARGKSGGGRVITCVKVTAKTMTLLTIYDKAEQEDIPDRTLTKILKDNDLL